MDRHSEEYSDKLVSLLQNEEYIDSALEIIDYCGYVYEKIREDFIKALEIVAKEEGFKMEYDDNLIHQDASGQSWIRFISPVSDKWIFHMGQLKCGGSIIYGISLQFEDGMRKLPKYKIEKLEYIWQDGDQDYEFPMGWSYLWSETGKKGSGYWYDWNNTDTLRDMRNGKMLDFIRAELQKVKSMRLIETIIDIENTKR